MSETRPKSTHREPAEDEQKPTKRTVAADLIEATPASGGVGHWLLASPLILFLGWLWIDLFSYLSPIPWYWLDAIVAVAVFLYAVILPVGNLAHRLVTALPRPFQHSGWDVAPLEPVRPEEAYMVRYAYRNKRRAELTWERAWLRAAQGWVYLEIAAIFLGALLIIPIFLSATDFGFGQY